MATTTTAAAADKADQVHDVEVQRDSDKVETSSTSSASAAGDAAWQFLNSAGGDVDEASVAAVNLSSLRRKIDWHIVPLMFCCYTMQFLDKVILNYAAIMGLNKDLHLSVPNNDFSNLATYLFVALLCFEIPNIYLLQVFPAAKWLGINVTLWGVATACGAAATSYHTMLASRVFLGIFEATIGPSLMLISSQWYTKSEQAPRFSFWYLGLGLGQIVGGALSYAFQHVGAQVTPSGWRIMFITLGCVTVVFGLCVILFIPDTPVKAKWLSNVEKAALFKHVSVNQTGIASRKFRAHELLEGVLDPQIWLLLIAVVLLSVSSGVITTYSATLIRGLGFAPKQAALMNMPSGAVSIFFTLLVGYGIRVQSHRWLWIVVCIIPAIIGGGLMSFMPTSNRSGVLAGIYLVNAVVAPLAVFYNWTVVNVAGATKRAFACAIISGSFSIGNIIGPQTFRPSDAPDYHSAKLTLMLTQAACAIVTIVLFGYYVFMNKRRADQNKKDEASYKSSDMWGTMTDKENKSFVYSY